MDLKVTRGLKTTELAVAIGRKGVFSSMVIPNSFAAPQLMTVKLAPVSTIKFCFILPLRTTSVVDTSPLCTRSTIIPSGSETFGDWEDLGISWGCGIEVSSGGFRVSASSRYFYGMFERSSVK
jgi:hypothetical protein